MKRLHYGKLGLWVSFVLAVALGIYFSVSLVSAQEVSYCCEKTVNGAFCQNAAQNQCDPAFRSTPSSCEATSFCRLGYCFDNKEGTCAENTPQKICEDDGGIWAEDDGSGIPPPQCQLGCCLLGDQAAYVTQTRCTRLSALYGLETDFQSNIQNELACIAQATSLEKGACVQEINFERTCTMTTQEECITLGASLQISNTSTGVTFHKGFLCSAGELGTVCGPSEKTTCVENKDEVYFLDTCGNIANIYDSAKAEDNVYWSRIFTKEESCGAGGDNANNPSCGNCNYFQGSICKAYERGEDARPAIGDNICRDLSCEFRGDEYQHGETWCDDTNPEEVGSRYYRYVCFNNEVTVEPCADYRQEICIQDESNAGFRNAACRANQWQDCISQTNEKSCINTDKRDCEWIKGVPPLGPSGRTFGLENTDDEGFLEGLPLVGGFFGDEEDEEEVEEGACVPKFDPGLDHWNSEGEALQLCSLANAECIVKYEEGVIGDKKCVENCECLESSWEAQMLQTCRELGDCGDKVNIAGVSGYNEGYSITKKKYDEDQEPVPVQTTQQQAQQPRFTGPGTEGQQPAPTQGSAQPGQTIGGAVVAWVVKVFDSN